MGKLILCHGSYANHPYYMEIGNVNIYSIEELNYYLVDKLDMIIELEPKESLTHWVRDQLHMEALAEELAKLLQDKASNKKIIQAILNSCGYYSKDEKHEILQIIEELEHLPEIQRKIKKGDNFLLAKNYKAAERSYETLIGSGYAESSVAESYEAESSAIDSSTDMGADSLDHLSVTLTDTEYAQILHNLGITKIYTAGIREACPFFKQAYERNHEEKSLNQYLISLKLSKQDDRLEEEITNYGLDSDYVASLEKEIDGHIKSYETSKEYNEIIDLEKLKDTNYKEFSNKVSNVTKELKNQYRRYI